MTEPIEVLVPIRAVSVANTREHWAAKAERAKKHRMSTHLSLRAEAMLKGTTGPLKVTITRIGKRTLDGDNLQSACKACRDGVSDWLGRDDGDPLIDWQYAQEKGDYAVRVRVEA